MEINPLLLYRWWGKFLSDRRKNGVTWNIAGITEISFPWHFWSSVINTMIKPFWCELNSSCSWLMWKCQVWCCKKHQCFTLWHTEAAPGLCQRCSSCYNLWMNSEAQEAKWVVKTLLFLIALSVQTEEKSKKICGKQHFPIIPWSWMWTGRATTRELSELFQKSSWTLTPKSK